MITKQTTKRAAKILAERKEKYAREFERAKGDSKAIARAAAEYRSEYGKTPLKRWHNALSQAAKETASHTAPKRKPAKPATKTAAKPAKPAATWREGAYIQDMTNGTCYQILRASVMPLKNPYIRYDVRVETESKYYEIGKTCTIDDKPKEVAKFKVISAKDVLKIRKIQENQPKRMSAAEEKAQRLAHEKEDKEKFKAAHKLNPDWIKDFAKQTGVSQAVIKALYAICDNPSRKEDLQLRPILGGIYCDPDGHIVATDAYILVSVQANIPKSMAGNIYLKSGQQQAGKYPNYKAVLAHYAFLPNGKHRVRPYIECKGGRPATTQTDWKGNKYFEAFGGHWREDQYRLILNVFEAIGESPKGYHIDAEKEAKYKIAHEEFYKDVEFNSIKAKLLATNPMSYVSKRVQAIQTPTA